MNRDYLLDCLDGLKGLVFRLLPAEVSDFIACVPMTTDGPWTDPERAVFETAIGIPGDRTLWMPGGFVNVPSANDPIARSNWVNAVRNIDHRYLFLDPDTGFYAHHNGESEKKVLIAELAIILERREVLIVYRHNYWPNPPLHDVPPIVYPYVWHGLQMLRAAGLAAFAYQSQAASLFFVSNKPIGIEPFRTGLEIAFAGVAPAVIERRLIG